MDGLASTVAGVAVDFGAAVGIASDSVTGGSAVSDGGLLYSVTSIEWLAAEVQTVPDGEESNLMPALHLLDRLWHDSAETLHDILPELMD